MPDITWNINAQVARGHLNQALVASGVTANMNASGINTLTLTPGTNAAGTVAISTASMSSVGLFFARTSNQKAGIGKTVFKNCKGLNGCRKALFKGEASEQ